MSATTERALPLGGPVRRGRRLLLLLTAAVALVLAGAGAWRLFWPFPRRREPPAVRLDGVEPGVAKAVEVQLVRVRAEPESGRAWGDLGVVLTAHNFRNEANQCFAEAERLEPHEPSWPYLHALTLLEVDPNDGTAVELLGRAADLCGAEPDVARLRLAGVLLWQGRAAEAEKQFQLLLERDPGHPPAHLGLARLALARDDPKEALNHLQYSFNSPFTRKAAWLLTAEVRQRMDDRDLAGAALRQAAAAPDDAPWPDPFLEEAEAAKTDRVSRVQSVQQWRREGQTEKAEEAIQEIREDDPAFADCKDGEDLLRRGDFAGAERILRRAVEQAPESAEAHFVLGLVLLRQKDAGGAAACFRRVLQLQPDHAAACDHLGQALALQGDRAGAVAALQTAVRYLPQQADLQRRLGELLAEDGRDAEAFQHLRHALYLDPDDVQAKALIEQVSARDHSLKDD